MRLLALAAAALIAAPATAGAAPLERRAPIVVPDADETSSLTSVQAFAGRVPGVRPGRPRPVLYGRRVGPWLQYWMLFARDDQDLGVAATGRREGDWELVQYRLERGRIVEGVTSGRAAPERCGAEDMRFRRGRPVVFLANGSHAPSFVRGVRDRTWPAPNDEADGDGFPIRARVVRIGRARPEWLAWPGRWGGTRAGWVPGEQDSPRGPMSKPPGAWANPTAWAATAHPCTGRGCNERGECDEPETVMAAALAALGLLVAFGFGRRRLRAG